MAKLTTHPMILRFIRETLSDVLKGVSTESRQHGSRRYFCTPGRIIDIRFSIASPLEVCFFFYSALSKPSLVSALPADEISLWEWQEYAVYSRISLRTVQKVRQDAG